MNKWLLFPVIMPVFIIASCAQLPELSRIKTPVVSLTNVKYKDIGAMGLTMETELQIENPNGFPIYIEYLNYNLSLSGVEYGRGGRKKRMKIKAYSKKKLKVPVQLAFLDMVSSIGSAISKKSGSYKLEGEIVLRTASGDHPRPFVKEGTVNILSAP